MLMFLSSIILVSLGVDNVNPPTTLDGFPLRKNLAMLFDTLILGSAILVYFRFVDCIKMRMGRSPLVSSVNMHALFEKVSKPMVIVAKLLGAALIFICVMGLLARVGHGASPRAVGARSGRGERTGALAGAKRGALALWAERNFGVWPSFQDARRERSARRVC